MIDYINGFRHCLYAATELAKTNLALVHKKVKRMYYQRAKGRNLSEGHQMLLPLVVSPFQAKFMGPYMVLKQLSEQNYLIVTPD